MLTMAIFRRVLPASRRRLALTLALAALVSISQPIHSVSAVSLVPDPERNSQALTGWAWYQGVSAGFLSDVVSKGFRIIDLEVESPAGPTFAATLVKNTGVYKRTWWWYSGKTASQVASLLRQNTGRLIDVDPYTVGQSRVFAVVMVKNAGASKKTWWWNYDKSVSQLTDLINQRHARIVDLDSYDVGGQTKYAAVMIANGGVDATSWWWYVNRTPEEVAAQLNSHKARLIDIERNPTGSLDVVMVKSGGGYWWWYVGVDAATLGKLASQNGARIFDIESYDTRDGKRFDAIMLNDLNAEGTRLRQLVAAGFAGGTFGFYLKKVGDGVPVGLQQGVVFEPASSIKVLHHLYGMQKAQNAQNDDDKLSANLFFWKDPDAANDGPGVCPDPAWETNANRVTVILKTGLYAMLQDSDNRVTRGFQKRFGQSNLNAFAASIGMSNTVLRQILGCGFQNDLRNDTTLVDLGKLYEGVANATFLTGGFRSLFWNLMIGGGISSNGALAQIVKDEAAKLGKSGIANAFISRIDIRSKGGSYDACPPSGPCSPPYIYIRTGAGRITLPFKSGGSVVPTDYVFGDFVDGLVLDCPFKQSGQSDDEYAQICPAWKAANDAIRLLGNELFRSQIRAALKTW